MSHYLSIAKRIPATVFLFCASLIIAVATQTLWSATAGETIVAQLGYGIPAFAEGNFWSIIAGLFVAAAPLTYIVLLPLLFIVCGRAEYLYGTKRTLVVMLASHIGAVALVAACLLIADAAGAGWAQELTNARDVGISNLVYGVAGALTAGFTPLWRVRARLILLLIVSAFMLYAASIWDLTHFAGLLVGLALGPWLVGRTYEKPTWSRTPATIRAFSATLVVFSAIATAVDVAFPANGTLFHYGLADAVSLRPIIFTVAYCALSFLIAYGLYRARRNAFIVALLFWIAYACSALLEPFSSETIFDLALSGIAFVTLTHYASFFSVRSDKQTNRRIWSLVLTVGVLVFTVHTFILWALLQPTSDGAFTTSLAITALQSIGIPAEGPHTAHHVIQAALSAMTAFWLLYLVASIGAVMLNTRRPLEQPNMNGYRTLLTEYGSYSLSWMGTWQHMRQWLTPSESMAVSYRLIGDVAIVLGNPIGMHQSAPWALKKFGAYCDAHGWTPAYFAVDESYKKMLKKLGYHSVEIGQDTIIHLHELAFTGKSWQSVRSSVNRAASLGITMQTAHYNEFSKDIQDQLHAIAKSWVADKSLPEMGFTLGTLHEALDPAVRMHLAVDAAGTVHGMTSWMPIFSNTGSVTGYTIDIMQRSLQKDAMPGVIEFLIAESALYFKEQGLQYISLSAAPLAGNAHNTPLDSLLTMLATRLEPYYGFQSLFTFKQKFKPEHRPLYLCYKDEAQLPRIAVAIGKAYTNEVSLIKTGIAGLRHKK